jgi:hypothetical protein
LDGVVDYVKRLKAAGANVKTIVYPGAHHVFDSPGDVKKYRFDNDGACQFLIQNNGLLLDPATGETFPEREYPGDHIKPCSKKSGKMGKNYKASKKYKTDVIDFMVEVLKP